MSDGPLAAYRARVAAGALRPDPIQELVAEKLQSLHHALNGYRPAGGAEGWKRRLGLARRRDAPPQGLYLVGQVGGGKTMLMDLFFQGAPITRKRRVHFHDFMQEVQRSLKRRRTEGGAADPLRAVARDEARKAWLLCFDEFQVQDIADAMILGRFFEALFDEGVVVVATSNVPPDELYRDGLQRERFLPFIELIRRRMDLLVVGAATDYRLDRLRGMAVYLTPCGSATDAALEEGFHQVTGGAVARRETLIVHGRRLEVGRAAEGVAYLSFAELCERPLGAADYAALAGRYHTLFLARVPRLGPDHRNEARRFVTLVDLLYERRVKLICSADAEPGALYTRGGGAAEFRRTTSRLFEMQSADYLALPHLADGSRAGGE